jgi:sucrose phosphorylase
VGALAGANDMELLNQTHNGRDINRHYYSVSQIDENLQRPVVQALNALCKLRNTLDAFDGRFTYKQVKQLQGDARNTPSIRFDWLGRTSSAALIFEPSLGLGVDNATSIISLEWTDGLGNHWSDDLLANPPEVKRAY